MELLNHLVHSKAMVPTCWFPLCGGTTWSLGSLGRRAGYVDCCLCLVLRSSTVCIFLLPQSGRGRHLVGYSVNRACIVLAMARVTKVIRVFSTLVFSAKHISIALIWKGQLTAVAFYGFCGIGCWFNALWGYVQLQALFAKRSAWVWQLSRFLTARALSIQLGHQCMSSKIQLALWPLP